MLKVASMVAYNMIYSSAANNINIWQRCVHACFIAIHVCSGKIRIPITKLLQKFIL